MKPKTFSKHGRTEVIQSGTLGRGLSFIAILKLKLQSKAGAKAGMVSPTGAKGRDDFSLLSQY